MASRPTLDRLYSLIENSRERSISGKYFIRPSKVREIFKPARINSAVAELGCDAHERIGLAKKIQQEGMLVFAILVWMRRGDHIVKFRNHDCLDNKLPISEARARVIVPEFGFSFAQDLQWQFLPYFFRQDMSDHHCQIDDLGMIFPFIEETDPTDGGHGQVSKVTIPTSLQEFCPSSDDTVTVVRKRVKRRTTQSLTKYNAVFTKEMEALRLLHRLNHPNVVPLLGSYTYNNEHNFLFPPFDMDLSQFFKRDSRFGEFIWDFNFSLALCGLASALEHTHSLHLDAEKNGLDLDAIGYHHDIRPANILVSKSTFVLTDFGLAKLKPVEENSETPWKVGAGVYIAPECMDVAFVHQKVGRAIDVWAFGCLVIEVVMYMERGVKGLEDFRQSRLSEMQPGFKTAFFHSKDGQLKSSVVQWFEELGNTSPISVRQLLQIATRSLELQPEARPQMSQIRRDLAIHSLGVLFSAALDKFTQYVENDSTINNQKSNPMQLWFEGERLRAFGQALSFDRTKDLELFGDFDKYNECCGVLLALFHLIQSELDSKESESSLDVQVEKRINLEGSVDERIQQLVQNLWDLFPPVYSRKLQAIWLQLMQRDDIERLDNIDTFLQSHRRKELADMGAMAHMRAIHLRMLHNPTAGAAEFLHPRTDLEHPEFLNGHTYGMFKKSKRVLIEWMYYRPEWTKIPQDQRLAIMELRAKDFNTDPKPRGLRILKCLGFIEHKEGKSRREGYGFIYELPGGAQDEQSAVPVTLRQLLLQGVHPEKGPSSQAPLRGRFQLAHALALFFEAFYAVGCLHETFNSNNVIFTHSIPEILASLNLWSESYVVGFQKSRPDGQNWATEGPSDDRSLHDYEHPEYTDKGRYVLEYDYYSLGLVLLEIGLWCPLQLWSDRKEYRNLLPGKFRDILVEKYVPRLASTVGHIYRDAVLTCLDGTLERHRAQVAPAASNAEIFDIFAERVVEPLEGLSRLRI